MSSKKGNSIYLNRITQLLYRARPRLAATRRLEFKNVFGAVGGYLEGEIFISCGRFGVALKLSSQRIKKLMEEHGVKRLKYFKNGHIKKDYVVLPKKIIEDEIRFKKLINESINDRKFLLR